MSTLTALLSTLRKSQLLPPETLKSATAGFQRQQAGDQAVEAGVEAGKGAAVAFCRYLVQEGLLTEWQTEKLLEGKYRGFLLGKYKLLGPLGAGGMSVVYLAENQMLGQRRAIKVLPKSKVADSSYLERFYREARAAAGLNHPHIVRTFDIDQQGDQHYMVMEYVEGTDMSALVKQRGPLDFRKAADYLRQAASALQHAHQAGLIHRDVKPGNFLLDRRGVVKLLDLGLAKFTRQTSDLTMVHNETLMGTADYLSPEQAIDSHQVDHRTDIYSLGGTFYFMIAGHPPFPEGSIAQRLVRHQAIDPPTLVALRGDCPEFLSQLCQWMMQKKREQRCPDCGEIIAWLDRWLAQGEQVQLPEAYWQAADRTVMMTDRVPDSGSSGSPASPATSSPTATPSVGPSQVGGSGPKSGPKAVSDEIPIPTIQVSKNPMPKGPISKSPISKSPVPRTPVPKNPVPKTPVSKTPVSVDAVSVNAVSKGSVERGRRGGVKAASGVATNLKESRARQLTAGYWLLGGLFFVLLVAIFCLWLAFRHAPT